MISIHLMSVSSEQMSLITSIKHIHKQTNKQTKNTLKKAPYQRKAFFIVQWKSITDPQGIPWKKLKCLNRSVGSQRTNPERFSSPYHSMSDSFEKAVIADREAKKNLVGCRRCFEHVPREEANTDSCSGCAASYDREYFRYSFPDFTAPAKETSNAQTAATYAEMAKTDPNPLFPHLAEWYSNAQTAATYAEMAKTDPNPLFPHLAEWYAQQNPSLPNPVDKSNAAKPNPSKPNPSTPLVAKKTYTCDGVLEDGSICGATSMVFCRCDLYGIDVPLPRMSFQPSSRKRSPSPLAPCAYHPSK